MVTFVRLVLSEQSYAAAGLMAAVGMGQDHLSTYNTVVLVATLAGVVVGALALSPKTLAPLLVVAVVLVAVGSFMDSRASSATRPEQLYFSQSLLAFASVLFFGPAMLTGVGQFLARGPDSIVTFVVTFGMTQSLGGLLGSALFGTFQVMRTKVHYAEIASHLMATSPMVAARLQAYGGVYRATQTDPVLRSAGGGAMLGQQAMREANVLAFNDVFFVIGVVAVTTLVFSVYSSSDSRGRAVCRPPPPPLPLRHEQP